MKEKIGKFLMLKVSPIGMFIGCLVVCLIVVGTVVKANNDNITVESGGTLSITNQATSGSSDNLGGANGYSVDMVSSPYVTANFPGDMTVAGNGTITGAFGVTATSTFTGNVLANRVFAGGTSYSSSTSKALTMAAATICDNNKVTFLYVTSSPDTVALTMPATSSVSSYCLKTLGQSLNFLMFNGNLFASSTILTANTDYNFYYAATSTTFTPSKILDVKCRRGSTAYDCVINQYPKQ